MLSQYRDLMAGYKLFIPNFTNPVQGQAISLLAKPQCVLRGALIQRSKRQYLQLKSNIFIGGICYLEIGITHILFYRFY